MDRTDHYSRRAISGLAIFFVCALLFVALILVLRQLNFETPASPHAKSLLKLDNTLGATVEPLDAQSARTLGGGTHADEMVVTSVAAGGRASVAGLRVGDVVEKVDGEDASNLDAAIDAVATDPTEIAINRHGSRLTLEIPVSRANIHA